MGKAERYSSLTRSSATAGSDASTPAYIQVEPRWFSSQTDCYYARCCIPCSLRDLRSAAMFRLLFLPMFVSALVATSATVPTGPLAALRGPMEKLRRLRSGAVVAEAGATEQMVPILVEVEVKSERLEEFLVCSPHPAKAGRQHLLAAGPSCSSSSSVGCSRTAPLHPRPPHPVACRTSCARTASGRARSLAA